MNVLEALPAEQELDQRLDQRLKKSIDLKALALDEPNLTAIQTQSNALSLKKAIEALTTDDFSLDLFSLNFSDIPSLTGFQKAIEEVLPNLKNINLATLLQSIASKPLDLDVKALPNIELVLEPIIKAVTAQPHSSISNSPWLWGVDNLGFMQLLKALELPPDQTASQNLHIIVQSIRQWAQPLISPQHLASIALKTFESLHIRQIQRLELSLPHTAINWLQAILQGNTDQLPFLDRYAALLRQLEAFDPAQANRDAFEKFEGIGIALHDELMRCNHVVATFEALAKGNIAELDKFFQNLLDPQSLDTSLLQPAFDAITTFFTKIFNALEAPAEDLQKFIQTSESLLNQGSDQSINLVQKLSKSLLEKISQIENFLGYLGTTLNSLSQKIQTQIEKIDLQPIIDRAKESFSSLETSVTGLLGQAERLKVELNENVQGLESTVTTEVEKALQALEGEMRELLDTMTQVLEKPEVKAALKATKQDIADIQNNITTASISPPFNLVLDKAKDLETKIKDYDTSKLSTFQKIAFKVGVEVIKKVDVNRHAIPVLRELFQEIRQPVAELLQRLRAKYLELETRVDAFEPATLAKEKILQSGTFQELTRALESIRPSQLLEPLKEAHQKLIANLASIDLNAFLQKIEDKYAEITQSLRSLDPSRLSQTIESDLQTVIQQLEHIRDDSLDSLAAKFQENLSLQKAFESTKISEIARADFWEDLRYLFNGEFLSPLLTALNSAPEHLAREVETFPSSNLSEAIAALKNKLEVEIKGAFLPTMGTPLNALADWLKSKSKAIQDLQQRRQSLIAKINNPSLQGLVQSLDLQPLIDLQLSVQALQSFDDLPTKFLAFKNTGHWCWIGEKASYKEVMNVSVIGWK